MQRILVFFLALTIVACTGLGPDDPPESPGDTSPALTPAEGPVGTEITITDPWGRLEPDDLAIFYSEGSDPELAGVPALGVSVSPDGKTLTATVPPGLSEGQQHYVAVRDSQPEASKFGDLPFLVTL